MIHTQHHKNVWMPLCAALMIMFLLSSCSMRFLPSLDSLKFWGHADKEESAIEVEQNQEVTAIHRSTLESKLRLPQAPANFRWRLFRNSLFLCPKAWTNHTQEESLGGLAFYTFAASPESFSSSKMFTIGITVQVLAGARQVKKVSTRVMAQMYLEPFLEKISDPKKDLLQMEEQEEEGKSLIMLRYRLNIPEGPRIVQKFTLTNESADTVNIFTFECPESLWSRWWPDYGHRFLRSVAVLGPKADKVENEYELRTE